MASQSDAVHVVTEDHKWTENVGDHPARADSPEYVKSRALMVSLAQRSGQFYGAPPWQDHHGGGLWLFENDDPAGKPFLVKNLVGIEWSSQFCVDPAKLDILRQNSAALYARFPQSAEALGITQLLATPITDAATVAAWTDSICNASIPLAAGNHTGIIESQGHAGIHHYPTPVAEIEFFKRDDFQLWVTDEQGKPMAVTPVAPRGSGEGSVEVQYADPSSPHAAAMTAAHAAGERYTLPADHPVARQAFAAQD